MIDGVLNTLDEQGLLTCSDEAQCVFFDEFLGKDNKPLPLIVKKSDGGYNYASTDLAAVNHRSKVEKADQVVYVTDQGQSLHFAMIFKTAHMAGLNNRTLLSHVPFGLVLGSDGKKFRTRSGDTVDLQGLLDQAISKAQAIMKDRNPNWEMDEVMSSGHKLGINSIKYADLSCLRTLDYVFDEDKMLSFDGNTAAFISYSMVRINSILSKLKGDSALMLSLLNFYLREI